MFPFFPAFFFSSSVCRFILPQGVPGCLTNLSCLSLGDDKDLRELDKKSLKCYKFVLVSVSDFFQRAAAQLHDILSCLSIFSDLISTAYLILSYPLISICCLVILPYLRGPQPVGRGPILVRGLITTGPHEWPAAARSSACIHSPIHTSLITGA